MAKASFVIKIQFKWWFKYYIFTLIFFCKIYELNPDLDKLKKVIDKALIIELDTNISET